MLTKPVGRRPSRLFSSETVEKERRWGPACPRFGWKQEAGSTPTTTADAHSLIPCAETIPFHLTGRAEPRLPTAGSRSTRNGHDDGGRPAPGTRLSKKANIGVDPQLRRRRGSLEGAREAHRRIEVEARAGSTKTATGWDVVGTDCMAGSGDHSAIHPAAGMPGCGPGPCLACLPEQLRSAALRRRQDRIVSGSLTVRKSHSNIKSNTALAPRTWTLSRRNGHKTRFHSASSVLPGRVCCSRISDMSFFHACVQRRLPRRTGSAGIPQAAAAAGFQTSDDLV